MNKPEAQKILGRFAAETRLLPYDALVAHYLNKSRYSEVVGPSGSIYNVRIEGFWDDSRLGNLRILFSIDDGGWRSFFPLTDDFIIAPNGHFIDED